MNNSINAFFKIRNNVSFGKCSDIFICKFDTNGDRLWDKALSSPEEDSSQDIAVDSNGNCYITGGTGGNLDGNTNAGSGDIFITKYDTNGNKQWTKLLGSSAGEKGYGISVDSNGSCYITGSTDGNLDGNTNAGESDIFISKYTVNGNKQWTKLLGSSEYEQANDIAIDSNGNCYITGNANGNLNSSTLSNRLS